MSWICQHLIRNKIVIRTKQDIDSDEFNDLIVVESKIKEMHSQGFLSDMDIFILDMYSDSTPMSNLEDIMGIDRRSISNTFIQICERVAYFLGGYFTDEGFMENIKSSYKLSEDNMVKLEEHIKGKFKHKLIRKTNND